MTPKEFCKLYSEQYGEPIDNVNQIVSHNFTGQELYDFVVAALRQPPVSGSYSAEDMSKAWSEGYHRKVDEINGNELKYFDVWLANYR